MPPKDIQRYNAEKEEQGDTFYNANPVLEGKKKDSKVAVDKMVKDLEDQIEKRKKFSRRRAHNDEEGIGMFKYNKHFLLFCSYL